MLLKWYRSNTLGIFIDHLVHPVGSFARQTLEQINLTCILHCYIELINNTKAKGEKQLVN